MIDQERVPRPDDWERSVLNFLSAGLSAEDLDHFVTVAMKSKAQPDGTWRYFCGCCWNEIADRQELARRLIEDGTV